MRRLTPRQRIFSPSVLAAEARHEAEINTKKIYGPAAHMVDFIRRKGWVVFKEGYQFRVGSKLGPIQIIMDIYEREKRREDDSIKAKEVDTVRPRRKAKARRDSVSSHVEGGDAGGGGDGSRAPAAGEGVRSPSGIKEHQK